MNTKKHDSIPRHFDELTVSLASPERILDWSFGEVTKPETINYRTQRPEKSGLFDEKIFGPEKDYECYCGKYRGIRFKGITCEKCGVELTRAIVRRERMGHIDLATPIAHIWYLRNIPSRIAMILGTSAADVEKVVYFAGYIVTRVIEAEKTRLLKDLQNEFELKTKAAANETEKTRLKDLATEARRAIENIEEGTVLDEAAYHVAAVRYGAIFEARIGAEALYDILKKLNLEDLRSSLMTSLETASAVDRDRLEKRLALVETMIRANIRPEWMFMTRLPVVPPALRPMVALEGGRHASSDLNDLYRRVINRNNRLKKLIAIHAPEVILRNEKRILQEAVDALLDNSIRRGNSGGVMGARRRELKSLADYLKGKHGYLRQNLLGKRVDYSGRSVIVVGPELELDECGLPKHMALELFRPFVIQGLLERELAYNIRGAGRLIEDGVPEVWAILEEVIKDKHVLLNRAPTLHRQSFQAFRPQLIEGNAIQLHPLVCPAFNADFDGDTMSVHVPLTPQAQLEAKEIMSANKNILKPGSGEPVVMSKLLDIVLGCYWMTQELPGLKGEGKAFPSTNAAITAYDFGDVDFRAKIKVLPSENEKYAQFEGKVFETTVGRLLFNAALPNDFPYLNDEITSKKMRGLVAELVKRYGLSGIPAIINKVKNFGFQYATKAGITWSYSDIAVPEEKEQIVKEGQDAVSELWRQYNEGLLTEDERYRLAVEIWTGVSDKVRQVLVSKLDPTTPVHNMVISGARGSAGQLHQMAGMKGLITNPRGEIIEFPILASMKEGLSPIEYFTSTHGARKGLADTALNTAKAGYLTRKLFDVGQDVIILEDDCGTKEGVAIDRVGKEAVGGQFSDKLIGRVLSQDVPEAGFKRNHCVSGLDAKKIDESGVASVSVRSPMTCRTMRGICRHCYGYDLSTQSMIDVGEAVGVVAAQAIGEPGTQLTMRTFHTGGVAAAGGDITMGLPRVEEVFERRKPKVPAIIAHIDAVVTSIEKDGPETVIMLAAEGKSTKRDTEYRVHPARTIIVKQGESVVKGQFMTDGSANLEELYQYAGKAVTQEHIINEITRIYELQGVTISRKHLELIVKQMFSRIEITQPGDTGFSIGNTVEDYEFERANAKAKADGKTSAKGFVKLLGIAEVSLTRTSFLSSVSFQHSTKKLVESSLAGAVDKLVGLKENVIIGRLIPAGTGFKGSDKHRMVSDMEAQLFAIPEEDAE